MALILVVDDDPGIRQAVGYALEDEGHQVDQAADGAAALSLIDRRHPDVILLDMKMPGIDGWEFVRRYRAGFGRRAAIVVVTAAQDAARRGAEVDADASIAKPFDLADLVECVAEIIRSRQDRSTN